MLVSSHTLVPDSTSRPDEIAPFASVRGKGRVFRRLHRVIIEVAARNLPWPVLLPFGDGWSSPVVSPQGFALIAL